MTTDNQIEAVTATFDGEDYEGYEVTCRVLDAPDGVVWVAATYVEGTDIQDGGYGIYWAKDDHGRFHYAVTDACAWPVYAATRDEAWEKAVELAQHGLEPGCPVDLAYDDRIPAIVYGDQAALYARIPVVL